MNYAQVRLDVRIAVQDDQASCLAACAAMAADHLGLADPDDVQTRIRSALHPIRHGGCSFEDVRDAMWRMFNIESEVLYGWDVRDLQNLVVEDAGRVILGIDPAGFYSIPAGTRHAVLLASGAAPILPDGVLGDLMKIDFVPPMLILDPHPAAPPGRFWIQERIEIAYGAAGRQALLIKGRPRQ